MKSEADIKLEEVRKYTITLASRLENVHRHTHTMLNQQHELGGSMENFATSFALLGQCESGSLGKGLGELGKTADALSHLAMDMSKSEIAYFQEILIDYSKMMAAIEAAFVSRDERMQVFHQSMSAVASAKANHDKIAQSPGKEAKVPAAKEDVVKAEAHMETMKAEIILINERMEKEVLRFKAQKLIDLKNLTTEYITRQIEYTRKVEEAWKSLLPALGHSFLYIFHLQLWIESKVLSCLLVQLLTHSQTNERTNE